MEQKKLRQDKKTERRFVEMEGILLLDLKMTFFFTNKQFKFNFFLTKQTYLWISILYNELYCRWNECEENFKKWHCTPKSFVLMLINFEGYLMLEPKCFKKCTAHPLLSKSFAAHLSRLFCC